MNVPLPSKLSDSFPKDPGSNFRYVPENKNTIEVKKGFLSEMMKDGELTFTGKVIAIGAGIVLGFVVTDFLMRAAKRSNKFKK